MIYFVHGFGFDPEDPKHDPHTTLYPTWEAGLKADATWFTWYSAPPTLLNVWRSWRRMRWTRYRYAWELSERAGAQLASLIKDGLGATVMCHSLGSRVALCALERTPIGTMLIFNGADDCEHALRLARKNPKTKFFNVVVKADDVLDGPGEWKFLRRAPWHWWKPSGRGVIGSKGLPDGPENWVDIPLDDPTFKAKAHQFGYDARGDNPDSIGDHSYSYNFPGNWELYRDILNDKCLMPL